MRFNCTVYESLTKPEPSDFRIGLSWPELVAFIGPPKPYTSKAATPLYSPGELLPNRKRGNANVACVHFGVLDLDSISEGDVLGLMTHLVEKGLAAYLTSTWSHEGKDACCMRLLVPFTRPVLPAEWPAFWLLFSKEYGGLAKVDRFTKDVSRAFYFPAHPHGPPAPPVSELLPGAFCDVDDLLASSKVPNKAFANAVRREDRVVTTRSGLPGQLNEARLLRLKDTWSRSSREHLKLLGGVLANILDGEAYAKETGTEGDVPEGRNNVTYALVCALVDTFPQVTQEEVGALLEESLSKMEWPSVGEVASMVVRRTREPRTMQAGMIQKSIGRPEPYTEEEYQAFADDLGVPLHELRNYFVIQKGNTYYILKPEGYIALTKEEFESSYKYHLAPASALIQCQAGPSATGVMRDKKPSEMVSEYGVVASAVIVDLTASKCTYDLATNNIIEAPCPIRVKPVFHADIQEWLELLGGENEEDRTNLIKWVALCPNLNLPCAALYLHGPGGVGKSLLGQGLSRLWSSDRPTGLDEVLVSNWNDALAKCPFIFADEHISRVDTAKIRELIQSRKRPYTRRYKPAATLQGCVRVLFAANNGSLFQSPEELTNDDISAISERFFDLKTTEAPKLYLQKLRKESPARVASWVEDDLIAEHALFLNKNLKIELSPDTRFAVRGSANSSLVMEMSIFGILRSQVCLWLVSFLRKPDKLVDSRLKNEIVIRNDKLYVRTSTLLEGWDTYCTERVPTATNAAKALAGLSESTTLRVDGKTARMREVNMGLLNTFALTTGFTTHENELAEHFEKLKKSLSRLEEAASAPTSLN